MTPSGNIRGSALVTTLLVIVVLTVIVTAFLQSMSIEQRTARSYLNRYKAELAAEAGLATAINKLVEGGNATDLHYVIDAINAGTEDEKIRLTRQLPGSKALTDAPVVLASESGTVTRVQVTEERSGAPAIYRNAGYLPINDDNGEEIGRFAYWTDAASMKQNVWTAAGANRDAYPAPGDLPLIQRNGTPVPESDVTILREKRANIVTVETLNQIVPSLDPPADDFDFTRVSPIEKLTPEGHKRLNLTRLKRYIDGGEYTEDTDGDGVADFSISYPGLDTEQGPTSERFLLISQLLNEDGNFPFHEENPWGPGNLEFLLDAYPEIDPVTGDPVEARQAVANLIDYIDADFIPTTDGKPGPKISLGQADYSTSSSQRTFNSSSLEIPASAIHDPPTVLGVEAKLENGKVRGHPYINGVTVGMIFNPTGGGALLNSSRILGGVRVANPWEQAIPWKTGLGTGYIVEMQVKMTGAVLNGSNGIEMHLVNSSSGYFMNAWLAQYSGISPADFINRTIPANQAVWFPRDWASGLDLANGPYKIDQNGITFVNFGSRIEVLRLVYEDSTKGERYLVQDLTNLRELPRVWKQSPYPVQGGIYKLDGGNGIGGQTDWHLNGDPRLNFRKDAWNQVPSLSGMRSPNKVYSAPVNPHKDGQQGLVDSSEWWGPGASGHFPTSAQLFRPSPKEDEPAMLSYAELGRIALGRPWQTVRLYKDSHDPEAPNDIPLIELVELNGQLPAPENKTEQGDKIVPNWSRDDFDTSLANGLINIQSPKRASLIALFHGADHVSDTKAEELAQTVLDAPNRPYESVSDLFGEGQLVNQGTTDFEKELLAAQVVPLATLRSNRFTVYIAGEARKGGRTLSRVTLKADVELKCVRSPGGPKLYAEISNKEIL